MHRLTRTFWFRASTITPFGVLWIGGYVRYSIKNDWRQQHDGGVTMRRVTLALIAMMITTPAIAQSIKVDRGNGSFFNKPGATAEQVAADTGQCRAIAEGADSQINATEVLAGGLGSIIGGAFAGGRLKRVNIENCMLVRGWRLFAMTRDEGQAWKALPEAARNSELAALVGAQTPARGSLLREWHNDYAEPVLWQKD
jgi:hypothetical protein